MQSTEYSVVFHHVLQFTFVHNFQWISGEVEVRHRRWELAVNIFLISFQQELNCVSVFVSNLIFPGITSTTGGVPKWSQRRLVRTEFHMLCLCSIREITWNFTGFTMICFTLQAWFCNECILILGRGDVQQQAKSNTHVQDLISIPENQRTIVNYITNHKYQSNREPSLLL